MYIWCCSSSTAIRINKIKTQLITYVMIYIAKCVSDVDQNTQEKTTRENHNIILQTYFILQQKITPLKFVYDCILFTRLSVG